MSDKFFVFTVIIFCIPVIIYSLQMILNWQTECKAQKGIPNHKYERMWKKWKKEEYKRVLARMKELERKLDECM